MTENYSDNGERPARKDWRRHDGLQKALGEAQGDMEAAVDWLRKKGLSAAAKKSGRVAAEGLVAVASAGNKAGDCRKSTPKPISSRATNNFSLSFCRRPRSRSKQAPTARALKNAKHPAGGTVQEGLTNLIATIGENMSLAPRGSAFRCRKVSSLLMCICAGLPILGKIGRAGGAGIFGRSREVAGTRQVRSAMHVRRRAS